MHVSIPFLFQFLQLTVKNFVKNCVTVIACFRAEPDLLNNSYQWKSPLDSCFGKVFNYLKQKEILFSAIEVPKIE